MQRYVLIYVNDLIVTATANSVIDYVVTDEKNEFLLRHLGPLKYFLGIELTTTTNDRILCQQHYLMDIPTKANMANCKPIKTPMATVPVLSKHAGEPC